MINRYSLSPHTGDSQMTMTRLLGIMLVLLLPGLLRAETVVLPLTVDYPLLRTVFISQAYADPEQTAVVVNQHGGCRKIVLQDPRFSTNNGALRFETRLDARIGQIAGDQCYFPLEWRGILVLSLEAHMDSNNWILSFRVTDSTLLHPDRTPAALAGFVWQFIKSRVHRYIEEIDINLSPPVVELKSFLQPLFPGHMRQKTDQMLESLHPGAIDTHPLGLKIELLTTIETQQKESTPEPFERISETQLEQFFDMWEAWDAFLVQIITSLAGEPLSEGERWILLDALLDTRYKISTDLSARWVKRDFVREHFIATWKKLSPIFRNHLGDDPSKDALGYLAFFTASDALTALDRIGPILGIDISHNGLIRLARLLTGDESVILPYRPEVDETLREILGLGSAPEFSGPAFDKESIDLGPLEPPPPIEPLDAPSAIGPQGTFWRPLFYWGARPAMAKETPPQVQLRLIKKWLVSADNAVPYMERVKNVLQDALDNAVAKNGLSKTYRPLYQRLIMATAWQESCFRQFKRNRNRLTYLRSYNGTSVGIMQINERVWRGLYDRDHLRWDIYYNAAAGSEIVQLYLKRYALRRIKKTERPEAFNQDTIARIVYAMYNSGPGEFYKFLARQKKSKYYLSDTLFYKKYAWVKASRWDKVNLCLFGG